MPFFVSGFSTQITTSDEKEIWKVVPGMPCRVSNFGKAHSLPRVMMRKNAHKQTIKGKMLTPHLSKNGKSVSVCVRPLGHLYIGRLVLLAFVGPCPEGMECCHNDGNPENNYLSNLRWDTHKNNEKDKIRHGTRVVIKGEDHSATDLANDDVLTIRKLYEKGGSYKKGKYCLKRLAEMYNMTTEGIRMIVSRETWKHI